MSPARRDRSRRRGQAALASLLTATLWFASEAAADSQHHPGAHLQRIRDGHARHHALADRFLPEDSPAGIDKRALIGKVGKAEHAAHHAQHQKHQQHGNGTIAAAHGKSGTSKVAKDHQTSQGYPGRYGQTTIAVPAGTDVGDAFAAPNSTSVLFIGGQVTGAGTYISNDVLHLSPRLPFAGPRADHPNPVLVPGLSNGLPPRAWGVGSMDAAGRVWVIGGVVEDCKKDAGAYVWIFRKNSTGVEWSPLTLAEPPARRRQADLITIIRRNYTATANHSHSPADTPPASPNVDEYPLSVATSNDTAIENTDCDFIIPGGIAEPYTCSPETVAYLGVDRWSPPSAKVGLNSTTVSTGGMPDPLPPPTYQVLHGPNGTLTVGQFNGTNATTSAGVATANVTVSNVTITHTHGKKTPGRKGPHPPITDYAMGLVDQRWVLIVGGQVTNGTLARTDEVAVLDTLFNEWSVIPVTGLAPVPRMGHSLTLLSEGIFLLYGGLSSTLSPLFDSYLLDTTQIPWRWRSLDTFVQRPNATFFDPTAPAGNVSAPARGYHSAVALSETEVLIAWGMGAGSRLVGGKDAFWQVTVYAGTAIWTRMGTPAILKAPPKPVAVVHKSASKDAGSSITTFEATSSHHHGSSKKPEPSHSHSRETKSKSKAKEKSKSSSTQVLYQTYAANTPAWVDGPAATDYAPTSTTVDVYTPSATAQPSSDDGSDSAPQTKTVVAGVVSAFVASAAIIGGLMLYGRRKALKEVAASDPNRNGGGAMPPVTTLFTRPANRRQYTFGTDTAKGTPDPTVPPEWATFGGRPATPPPGLARRAPTVAETPDSTLMRHRALFAETRLPSNSPMPAAVAPAARFETMTGRTPLTGDGSPIMARRLELSAPTLRRASASRDSGISEASVQSYPFLMSLQPQRSQSAMSSSTASTHSTATITQMTSDQSHTDSTGATVGHAPEAKEANPLSQSWMRRLSLAPGWGWSNAPAEGSAIEGQDITEAAPRKSIADVAQSVVGEAPVPIVRLRRSTKELRIVNSSPQLDSSPILDPSAQAPAPAAT